ncbi:hypothetical protein H0H87_009392 [Tephrocybe sp. NHM501043]|nr:hypothetical protein H0H87_009392 [Tephrocybe sp. NHM501043]
MVTASALALLPKFLRPLASRFSGIDAMIARCVKHLQPLIEERYQRMAEHGQDYPGKPTFSQALFDLATHPEFVQELRNEVESVVHCEGWTQAALNQMVKVDSFIRESQRLNTLGDLILGRVSRQPFTFSDGTVIPAGTFSYVAAGVAHTREETYKDAHTFRPFRFVEKREQTGRKVDMVSTHADFLSFGHGLHACPGRFFAAAELKLMLAHVVLTYDVKMAGDGERPKNMWYFTTCVPNPKAEVMFRKRAD